MRGAGERVGCRGLPGCSIMRAFLPFANIGVLCAAARSPCICSRLRVALGLWPKCPQGTRFPPARAWFRCPTSGRFGPSAQVPTGHTLPCAPAGVWGSSRSLNRRGGRWPRPPLVSLPRKYRRSVRWPRTALVFAHAFRSLWASGPSAHRAHASFRRTSRSLWASGPTAHRADAPLRCPKNLCRSTKRERCERPKGARNAAHPTFPKVPRTPLRLHQKKPPAPAQAGTGGHKARRINQANGFSVGYGSDAGRL